MGESLHHIFIFAVKAIAEQILIHISYKMYIFGVNLASPSESACSIAVPLRYERLRTGASLLAQQVEIQSKSLPRLRLRFEMALQLLLPGAKESVFSAPSILPYRPTRGRTSRRVQAPKVGFNKSMS